MSIITPKPGYQCNPSDCAIIIKENGQLDFIHPIVAPTDSQPKNLEVFKNIVAALNQQLLSRLELLEKDIYNLAGTSFNISSPKQLSDILFNKMNLY